MKEKKTYRLIEHPDDLIRGKTYSVMLYLDGKKRRLSGRFERMELAYAGYVPRKAILYVLLVSRDDCILVKWRNSFNWREV